MPTLLSRLRSQAGGRSTSGLPRQVPQVVSTSYSSTPVDIPDSFLCPLLSIDNNSHDPTTPSISNVTVKHVDFTAKGLPEYEGLYAVVIDGLLSKEECATFIDLTECSAGKPITKVEVEGKEPSNENDASNSSTTSNVWKPAMVNAGVGHEFLATDYRHSERIIWDNEELTRRLWARVMQLEQVEQDLAVLDPSTEDSNAKKSIDSPSDVDAKPSTSSADHGGQSSAVAKAVLGNFLVGRNVHGEKWRAVGLNERMRVLRYGQGMFFKPHCDGTFERPNGDRSFLTLHLYLNDSTQAVQALSGQANTSTPTSTPTSPSAPTSLGTCTGGATPFHSRDHHTHGNAKSKSKAKAKAKAKAKSTGDSDNNNDSNGNNTIDIDIDIDPLAGRVLIFQHRGLLHSGAEVTDGVKYTMRTDVMYKFEGPVEEKEEREEE